MPLISFKPDPERGPSVGSKEKIFLEHYDWLLRSALTFTRGSRSRAEDLVHDLFVQFQLKLKSLEEVDDLRAYLYGMLRNLYASQLRRASRHAIQQLSILDHDSVSIGLRAHDFSDRLETLSVLTRACEFVCHRKETTLTASIFILRYFHGYYPDEIATLLGASRDTVDKWLSRGRAEAKKYLAEPYPIPVVVEKTEPRPSQKANSSLDFFARLRGMIFASRTTPCDSVRRGKKQGPLSLSLQIPAPSTQELAHLASCAACLNKRSRQHGLPGLEARTFDEPYQREDRREPPAGGSGTSTFIPTPKKSRANKLRKGYARTRELIQHYPTELSIAVDGQIRTSHVISSSASLLNLTVDAKERVEFVEILSEQGVRFLMLDRSDLETVTLRRYDIALSDGRLLEVEIVPDVPGPCIQVSYRDPHLAPTSERTTEPARPEIFASRGRLTLWLALRAWFSGLPGSVRIFAMLAVPICAVLALSLIFWKRPETRLLPGDVLQQTIKHEQALPVNAAAHSVFTYQETDASGHLQLSGEVESWRQAVPRRLALRLYDAHHALVGGFVQDLRGSAEYSDGAGSKKQGKQSEYAQTWRDVPSAERFASLLSPSVAPEVTESGDQYRIEVRAPHARPEIVDAVLVVNRRDLRAVEADYDTRDAAGVHHVRLREVSYEVRSADGFDHGVFDVGRDFDTSSRHSRITSEHLDKTVPNTASLELQVLTDLMQAGANAGEQVEVHRDRLSGMVEVRGVVDTPERKAALLQAVAPLVGNPYLRIALRSSDELPQPSLAKPSKRKRSPLSASPSPAIEMDTYQAASSTIPADAAIRAYLKTKGTSGEQLDNAVRSFASEACARSLEAQQRAYRLAQLSAEFSPADLAQLDPASRLRWLVLVDNYSEALDSDLRALRNHLQPVIKSAPGDDATPPDAASSTSSNPLAPLSSPDELAVASRNILSQTARLNQQVQSAFSVVARSNSQPDLPLAGNGAFSEMMPLLNAAESMAGNVSATAQHLQLFATNAK
jgi:RNA polymerase sigma factor (sigma-70 family)